MTHTSPEAALIHSNLIQSPSQKFGRIEDVHSFDGGIEIHLIQPDSSRLAILVTPKSVDTGFSNPKKGRNMWISGHIDGDTMTAEEYAVYPREP